MAIIIEELGQEINSFSDASVKYSRTGWKSLTYTVVVNRVKHILSGGGHAKNELCDIQLFIEKSCACLLPKRVYFNLSAIFEKIT